MESFLGWITHYGYAGLFVLLVLGIVALPIPDEPLLVFSGYLISIGRLRPGITFLVGVAGCVCGISISYLLGRTIGHKLLTRYSGFLHISQARVDRIHRWFDRVGNWLLAFGYFVPGIRHLTALVAGTLELDLGTFALFAYSGAALWVGTFLTIGYFVGERWPTMLPVIERYLIPATVVTVLVGVALWLWKARGLKREN